MLVPPAERQWLFHDQDLCNPIGQFTNLRLAGSLADVATNCLQWSSQALRAL